MLDAVGRGSGIGPGFGVPAAPVSVALARAVIVAAGADLGALAGRRAAHAQVAEVLRAE